MYKHFLILNKHLVTIEHWSWENINWDNDEHPHMDIWKAFILKLQMKSDVLEWYQFQISNREMSLPLFIYPLFVQEHLLIYT